MEQLIAQGDGPALTKFVLRQLSDDVMTVGPCVQRLRESQISPRVLGSVCRECLPSFGKFRGILDAVEAELRELYSECLQAEGLFVEAADQLAQADGLLAALGPAGAGAVGRLLQIADLYLEAGDSVSAETFVHKAGYALASAGAPDATEPTAVLKLRHTLAYARVLDAKLRPIEALHKYLEVVRHSEVASDDKIAIIYKAVICAVLVGLQRLSASLKSAMKQELRLITDREIGIFAGKIIHGEFVEAADVAAVANLLETHHLATTSNGKSVFTNALIEHNVRAIALACETVAIRELAQKLALPEHEVFETIMKMASDKKIFARIDQEIGVIHFPAPVVTESDKIRLFCERLEAAEKKAKLYL